jgi:hypothetical protein
MDVLDKSLVHCSSLLLMGFIVSCIGRLNTNAERRAQLDRGRGYEGRDAEAVIDPDHTE